MKKIEEPYFYKSYYGLIYNDTLTHKWHGRDGWIPLTKEQIKETNSPKVYKISLLKQYEHLRSFEAISTWGVTLQNECDNQLRNYYIELAIEEVCCNET